MKTQTYPTRDTFRYVRLAVILSFALHNAAGQTVDSEQESEEVIELSRFIVNADESTGYRATSTLAGTRVKTDIKDIGSALSVVPRQFLEDTASTDSQDLLVYTTGTEVGGTSGNYTGAGNGVVLSERDTIIAPNTVTRVRGLANADNTRDLFLTDIPWDAYYVDRMELQRGPNSILFGLGKPGGVINASLKQARFNDINRIETRVGSEGSVRLAVDFNRVLLEDELAIRINALADHTNYQQKPAFNDDERIFGAVRYDPSFLNQGSAHTTLRVNFERGAIDSNNPRSLPPMDRITSWFDTGTTTVDGRDYLNPNQFTGDFRYRTAYFANVPNSGYGSANSPGYIPAISDTNHGNYLFIDGDSGLPASSYYVPRSAYSEDFGLAPSGAIDGSIRGLFGNNRLSMVATNSELQRRLGVPFAFAYKNKSITDPSLFDFYHLTLDGPNKKERRDFDALNVTLSQTFWNNRLGIEAVMDRQNYQDWNDAYYYGLGTGDATITVDVNEFLPDQTPNPNVGRPMIVNRSYNGGGGKETQRDVLNLTAYAELRADDFMEKSWLTKLLGRHVFTAAASDSQYDSEARLWASAAVTSAGLDTPANEALLIRREVSLISYLGGDLRGRSLSEGLNLSNISGEVSLPNNSIVFFDSHWNQPTDPSAAGYVNPGASWVNPFNNQTLTQSENPDNYVGWRSTPTSTLSLAAGDRDLLTYNAQRRRDEISSQFFVWQGYFWDGLVVPTFGYRKDTAKAYSSDAPSTSAGYVDRSDASYNLATTPDNEVEGETKSYSLVVHTPQFIQDRLPAGLSFSLLYNKSSNFEPAAGRVDVLGGSLENPTGRTEDYGIVVSAFNDRLRVKVNKFETSAQNATYVPQTAFWLMQVENLTWIRAKRFEAGLSGNSAYEGQEYNYGSVVNGVFVQTAADRTRQQQDVQAVLSNFNPAIWKAWGVEANDERWQNNLTTSPAVPSGFSGTEDSVSSGYEIEIDYQPVPNWSIAFNAARAEAVRDNIGGKVMNEWTAERNAVWNGAGGNLLVSGVGDQTHGELWNGNFYGNYQLDKLLEGSSAPEVRRWRFNLINNYRFTSGRLKGLNLGGAYRWEDRVVLGYPSIYVTLDGQQLESFDIANPYYGPGSKTVDLWAGYSRKLSDRIDWKIQLNVRNALGKNELVPINAQPDGGPAAFRIKTGLAWTLTNTFEF